MIQLSLACIVHCNSGSFFCMPIDIIKLNASLSIIVCYSVLSILSIAHGLSHFISLFPFLCDNLLLFYSENTFHSYKCNFMLCSNLCAGIIFTETISLTDGHIPIWCMLLMLLLINDRMHSRNRSFQNRCNNASNLLLAHAQTPIWFPLFYIWFFCCRYQKTFIPISKACWDRRKSQA